jgi:hypothetical protein
MSDLPNIYDQDTGMLSIVDDVMEAEFKVATHQAVESMAEDFMFHGYTIETSTAIDVVQAMLERRTYH